MPRRNHIALHLNVALSVVLLTSIYGLDAAWAHPPGEGTHSHYDSHVVRNQVDNEDTPSAHSGPHGGQISQTAGFQFEVFYGSQETRLYIYNAQGRPISASGLRGEVVFRVRGNDRDFRFPLEHVRTQREEFAVARVDVSGIRDGDMQAIFDLYGLPNRSAPNARFSQTFALSRQPLSVTVAPLTSGDRIGIARQKNCPVMETALGDHGTPIKLLVGDQPLYVCCQGCVGKVQASPEEFLSKLADAARQSSATPSRQISVAYATAEDATAVRAQGRCVVMTDQQLGGHGQVIKVSVGRDSVFVCCKGCIRKVEQNPELYLDKARQLRASR